MGGVYGGWVQVYTDGWRAESGETGFGVEVPERVIEISRHTTDGLGVNTVEMVAVLVALNSSMVALGWEVKRCSENSKFDI